MYLVNSALGDTVHRIEQDRGDQVEFVNPSLILASDGSTVNLIESRIDSLCDLLTRVQLCVGRFGTNGLIQKLGGSRCNVTGGALMHLKGKKNGPP